MTTNLAIAAVYYLLIAATSFWVFAGIFSIWRTRRSAAAPRSEPGQAVEALTILKPLCGVDVGLEENLRTFFEQDYPNLELVFGVRGDGDPAGEVVRTLQQRYPAVRSRLVVHDSQQGLNPKVSNLRAMMPFVHSDLVVISDSNIRVHQRYVSELVQTLEAQRAGLVTSLIRGAGARTLGARLDALHLNGEVAAGAAVPTVLGDHPVVVGKSMLFRLSTLKALGGLASVAHILAEDYVIGRMLHEAGHKIAIAPTPIINDCGATTVRGFFSRHLRWGMIRIRLQPFAFLAEPITKPWAIALFAPLFGFPLAAAAVWALALSTLRDVAQNRLLGARLRSADLPLSVVRDLVAFAAWLVAPFRRHIRWRQTRVRVSAGTRLYQS